MKRYNTPHRSHVVKTRLTDEEYADFTARLAPYGMSQSEFIRQAITRATIRPIVTVSPVNDELLAAVGKLTAEYGRIGGFRTSDWVFPARSGFTTFCHQKVAPKVSAGRKSRGTADGLRLKRYADELAPAFSTAQPPPVLLPDFSQCGVCCALHATMIYSE